MGASITFSVHTRVGEPITLRNFRSRCLPMAWTLPVEATANSVHRRFVGSCEALNCACFKLMLF